jgi:hypothetical protein
LHITPADSLARDHAKSRSLKATIVETVDADLFHGSPVLAVPIPPSTEIKIAGIKIAYVSFYKSTSATAAELVSVERHLFQPCESIDDVEHQQRTLNRGLLVVRWQFKVEHPGELS